MNIDELDHHLRNWDHPPVVGANSDPPNLWHDYLSGRTTSLPATEARSLNLSAVFCAVTVISNAMKCLPLFVYERLADRGKRPATEHPNFSLLHDRPSGHLSPSRFQRLLTMWAVLWGNGRAVIDRDRKGRVVALFPVHPSKSKTNVRADDSVWHIIDNKDGTFTEVPDRDMFHIQGLSEDGIMGISVLGKARQSFGLAVSAEDYGLRFFDNNARPSILLKHPAKLTPEAQIKLKSSWAQAFGGKNQHGTAVLEEGMDVHTLGMPNEDAQFLETRQFQTIEIARWFNIQPHKLKDLERATFSNIVEQSLEFVGDTILPWAVDWEQEANRKLFTEEDQGRFFAEFLLDALLRADPKSRNEAFEIQRRNGVLNANTWRARENMNPIDGAEGEMYIVMGNMVNAKSMAEGGAVEPVTVTDDDADVGSQVEDVAKAHIPIVADVFHRMFRVQLNAAKRAAKKTDALDKWAVTYFAAHEPTLRSALIPCVESLGAAVRVVVAGDPTDDQWDMLVGGFTKTATTDYSQWARMAVCNTDIEDDEIQVECLSRADDLVSAFAERAQGEIR